MKKLLFYITLLSFTFSFSQTKEQIKEITKFYDINEIKEFALISSEKFQAKKESIIQSAYKNNWEVRYKYKGRTYELFDISKKGTPIYYTTYNSDASKSTRTNHLHNNGSLGLNLEGQNMNIYIWDLDQPKTTHQEFDDMAGNNRHIIGDNWQGVDWHATHVMGTLIATGIHENAKGMTPQAIGYSYHWASDLSEMADATLEGMLISSHSYGLDVTVPDNYFGAYKQRSVYADELMRLAPYYLLVTAAGNAGLNDEANGQPLNGNQEYDKLAADFATCKNGLTVANAQDAEVTSDGELINVLMNGESSQGPTDDLRIKPDITGNGTSVYSTKDLSNTSYGYASGTSMATPNVAGTLLLLQQHYNETNGNYMKAATLKGLALHTADDMEMIGPDAISGWGLLNAKKAAQTITDCGTTSLIFEETIVDLEDFSIKVESDNISPLLASLSWTDIPGLNINVVANDTSPKLVNDLNLRISDASGTVYEPWKLIDVDENTKGDNKVDPFERVDVDNANGTYTITITSVDGLYDQDFSLIITGLASYQQSLNAIGSSVEICDSETAIFDFSYHPQSDGIVDNTIFTAGNLSEEVDVNFIFNENRLKMELSNLHNLEQGDYLIDVIATNQEQIVIEQVTLTVKKTFYNSPKLLYPTNNSIFDSKHDIVLDWIDLFNIGSEYHIQIATDPIFHNIVVSELINETEYLFHSNAQYSTYYWRVAYEVQCNNYGGFSNVNQFKITPCTFFKANDNSINLSTANSENGISLTYHNLNEYLTSDIALNLEILHNNIGSLLVTLTNPQGTKVNIISPNIDCNANYLVSSFRDASLNEVFCDFTEHNYSSNNLKPEEILEIFSEEFSKGTWTLNIKCSDTISDGTLKEWGLVFCEKDNSYEDDPNLNYKLWPNPVNKNVNILFKAEKGQDTQIHLFNLEGKLIDQYEFEPSIYKEFNKSIDLSNLPIGFYILKITHGFSIYSDKIIIHKL